MSPGVAFRRSPLVLWRRVDDEVLIADGQGSDVSSLSLTASTAWLTLDRPRTRDDLADELATRFRTPSTDIGPQVERVLHELVRRGWVVREDADG
jgi:Coenzyme PQQ synthesis protein D (PqqD)